MLSPGFSLSVFEALSDYLGFYIFHAIFQWKGHFKIRRLSLILTSNLIVYLKFLIKLDTKSFVISLG